MSDPDNGAKVSRRSDLVLVVLCLCVFIPVALVASLEKALAFSVAVGVFVSIIQTERKSWSDKRFWMILAVFGLMHIVVLSLIHIPPLQYGLECLPFALADGFAMWGIIKLIQRHFPRAPNRAEP
jgi:hypothetical protein